jgi:hypothetical protein
MMQIDAIECVFAADGRSSCSQCTATSPPRSAAGCFAPRPKGVGGLNLREPGGCYRMGRTRRFFFRAAEI